MKNGKLLMEVKVIWDTNEEMWEPLSIKKADDPVLVSKCVEEEGLTNKPYWKWATRYLKNKTKDCAIVQKCIFGKEKDCSNLQVWSTNP